MGNTTVTIRSFEDSRVRVNDHLTQTINVRNFERVVVTVPESEEEPEPGENISLDYTLDFDL